MTTTDYSRTVDAPDADTAAAAVKALARGEGYVVRTVRRITAPEPGRWTVVLAVVRGGLAA